MRPQRPQQGNPVAGIGILVVAFVVLALALAVLLPLLSSHEGTAIDYLGTPIAALATARAAGLATVTASPTATSTASSIPTPSATPLVATPTPTPPPSLPTATTVPVTTGAISTKGPTPTATPTALATVSPANTPVTPTTDIAPTTDAPPLATGTTVAVEMPPTAGPSLASLTDPHFLGMLAARVIALTNHERTTRGLLPLTPDAGLSKIAVQRSEDMIQRDYFSHYDPATHQAAVVELLNRMVIPYHEVGENIVDNRNEPLNDGTPGQVVAAWMNSKEHRTNILDPAYTNIGVGIAVAQQDGALRVVFAQVFLD